MLRNSVSVGESGLVVTAVPADIGALAHRAGVPLSLLQPERAGLEEVFLELVGSGTEFVGSGAELVGGAEEVRA